MLLVLLLVISSCRTPGLLNAAQQTADGHQGALSGVCIVMVTKNAWQTTLLLSAHTYTLTHYCLYLHLADFMGKDTNKLAVSEILDFCTKEEEE